MSCSRRSCYFHSCIYVTLWMKFWLSSAASPREQRTRFRPKDGRIFSMWDLPTAGNSSRHDASTVKIAVDDWFRSSDWIENGIVRDTKMSRLRHRTTTVLGSYLNGASSLPLREPRFFDAKKEGNDKKIEKKEGIKVCVATIFSEGEETLKRWQSRLQLLSAFARKYQYSSRGAIDRVFQQIQRVFFSYFHASLSFDCVTFRLLLVIIVEIKGHSQRVSQFSAIVRHSRLIYRSASRVSSPPIS